MKFRIGWSNTSRFAALSNALKHIWYIGKWQYKPMLNELHSEEQRHQKHRCDSYDCCQINSLNNSQLIANDNTTRWQLCNQFMNFSSCHLANH